MACRGGPPEPQPTRYYGALSTVVSEKPGHRVAPPLLCAHDGFTSPGRLPRCRWLRGKADIYPSVLWLHHHRSLLLCRVHERRAGGGKMPEVMAMQTAGPIHHTFRHRSQGQHVWTGDPHTVPITLWVGTAGEKQAYPVTRSSAR